MYTNADSISNKMDELRLIAANYRPHIIAITEYKPKNARFDLTTPEIALTGYNTFVNPTTKGDGLRGCVLYVSTELSANQLDLDLEHKDATWIKIKLVNKDCLVVGCVYRSPSAEKLANANLSRSILRVAEQAHSHLLIMGDFNYPTIDWATCTSTKKDTNDDSNVFLETVKDAYLFQHVTRPTRCRINNTPSTIDLIFTNEEGMINDLELCSPMGKSDHSIIHFNLTCYSMVRTSQGSRFMYDRGDYDGMRQFIQTTDWGTLLGSNDVQAQWAAINQVLSKAMDKYIPKREIRTAYKRFLTPLDKKTVAKIKKKHRAWARFMETREGQHYNKFCRYRNEVRKLSRKARCNYEQQIADEAKSNPKKFWSFARNQTKTRDGVADLQKGGDPKNLTVTDREKAEVLLEQFTSVFTKEPQGDIPRLDDTHCDAPMQQLDITADMVKKKLAELKPNKSPGPDGISPRVYYELSAELAAPLASVFNNSLRAGKVPSEWKTAVISAIFKKGNRKEPANYRPISLTNIASKVMESLVRDHILDHMQSNDLLSDRQFGFVKGRSTVLQLLHVVEKWTEMLDQGDQVDAIYMDFAKAFDKVPHKRLISKMSSYGISNQLLNWVTDFLSARNHRVRVNGSYSEEADVLSGIPQGSVLGPTLFILFINDLPGCTTNEVYLFADDTKIFSPITSDKEVTALQKDIDECLKWSKKWLLEFNKDKCKVLDISTRPRGQHAYHMQGTVLSHIAVEKDLGVEMDTHLKYDQHISSKAKKANALVAVIRRAFRNLNKWSFPKLFKGIVRPHLEYAAAVWNPHYKKDIILLENVQRRATKLVPGLKDLSYQDRLKELKLPTLVYRRLRGDMIEVFKMTSGYYDSKTPGILNQNTTDRGLRGHSKKIQKHRARLDVRKYSFSHRVVDVWNGLPEKVISAPSVKSFERRLDKHWRTAELLYDFKAVMKKIEPDRNDMDTDNEEDLSIEA
jgi:hypothetical protein